MAHIKIMTDDEVYDPIYCQVGSATFEHIDPQPSNNALTDIDLCSASSKYDIDRLAEFVSIGTGQSTAATELLEDIEDLALLKKMNAGHLQFRPFEEFMAEHDPSI